MAENGIMRYVASDGSDVKLTPAIVAKYVVTGDSGASDKEIYGFMVKCKARKLNPLAGDAYMTVFKGKASVIVSKDYFLRTATQQETFDGLKAGVVVANKHTGKLEYREGCIVGAASETLVGGWAEVFDKRRSVPSRAEVALSEYSTGRSMWREPSAGGKPATMIRKVALVQALREAYPGAYGGIYDSDEMPEPDVLPNVPEPVEVENSQVDEPTKDEHPDPVQEPVTVDAETGEVIDASTYEEDVDF